MNRVLKGKELIGRMAMLTWEEAMQLLLMHSSADGREEVLFGEDFPDVRKVLPSICVGDVCPHVYLEFPLTGNPFLDVTVLYHEKSGRIRLDLPETAGTEGMRDWFAGLSKDYHHINVGYELDTGRKGSPAAVHFQPRGYLELVEPFCKTLGEEEKGRLYLSTVEKMPTGWKLSFFGMFRGRSGSPLRVCGYLDEKERAATAADIEMLRIVFQRIGFRAFDEKMLHQIARILSEAVDGADFQFDVWPDGSFGETFAIDLKIRSRRLRDMRNAFSRGDRAPLRQLLEDWKIIDGRLDAALGMTFARNYPVEKPDGSKGNLSMLLMPQWIKIRWIRGELQPAKLYCLTRADLP